jgi:hypothetical protein
MPTHKKQSGELTDVDGILEAHSASLNSSRQRRQEYDYQLGRWVDIGETPEELNRRRLREIEAVAEDSKVGPRYISARQRKTAKATLNSANNSRRRKT